MFNFFSLLTDVEYLGHHFGFKITEKILFQKKKPTRFISSDWINLINIILTTKLTMKNEKLVSDKINKFLNDRILRMFAIE